MDDNALLRALCNFCMIADNRIVEKIHTKSPCGRFFVITPRKGDPSERLVVPVRHVRTAIDDPDLAGDAQRFAVEYLRTIHNPQLRYDIVTPIPPKDTLYHFFVRIIPYDNREDADVTKRMHALDSPIYPIAV